MSAAHVPDDPAPTSTDADRVGGGVLILAALLAIIGSFLPMAAVGGTSYPAWAYSNHSTPTQYMGVPLLTAGIVAIMIATLLLAGAGAGHVLVRAFGLLAAFLLATATLSVVLVVVAVEPRPGVDRSFGFGFFVLIVAALVSFAGAVAGVMAALGAHPRSAGTPTAATPRYAAIGSANGVYRAPLDSYAGRPNPQFLPGTNPYTSESSPQSQGSEPYAAPPLPRPLDGDPYPSQPFPKVPPADLHAARQFSMPLARPYPDESFPPPSGRHPSQQVPKPYGADSRPSQSYPKPLQRSQPPATPASNPQPAARPRTDQASESAPGGKADSQPPRPMQSVDGPQRQLLYGQAQPPVDSPQPHPLPEHQSPGREVETSESAAQSQTTRPVQPEEGLPQLLSDTQTEPSETSHHLQPQSDSQPPQPDPNTLQQQSPGNTS